MAQKISNRDWEQLSAYVDGQLNDRERVRLEKSLNLDPELNAELQELRRLRATLWRTPRLRAPRNFTLSPQKLGLPQKVRPEIPRRLYPAFGFTSALASLALVLLLVFDLLRTVTPVAAPPSAAGLSVPTNEVAALVDQGTAAPAEKLALSQGGVESSEPTAKMAQPEAGMALTNSMTTSLTSTLALTETFGILTEEASATKRVLQAPITVPLPVMTSEWNGMGVGGGEGEIPAPDITSQAACTPSAAVEVEAMAEPGLSPTPAPTLSPRNPTATPAVDVSAPGMAQVTASEAEPGLPPMPTIIPEKPTPAGQAIFRAVEGFLAVLVLAAGGIAIYLYRRSR